MIADIQLMEKIVSLVHQLSPEYRLRLIQQITETIIPALPPSQTHSHHTQFGEFSGDGRICLL
jgi:hemolysin-activating ACP:hemolysin acyltransferase